jgi:hypothetical protein
MTDTTTDTTLVDAYIDMWNTEDDARRAEIVAATWTADGSYLDPLLEADGRDAIVAMVGTVHGHYPGHRFRRTSGVDGHHDVVRFGWELVAPDGTLTVAGIDVGVVQDGKLQSIRGFFGDLPAA